MKWWDRSWNPMHGCTECSEGCRNCVALDNLRKQERDLAPSFNEKTFRTNLGSNLNYIVCSLGDMFHPEQTCENQDAVFEKMAKYNNNRYFILTKYSSEMLEYFQDEGLPEIVRHNDWDHLWMGVSVEDNSCLHRIDDLLNTPLVKHKFICVEPILEEISISRYLESGDIEWVIIGSETGKDAREANPEWFRKIIGECGKYNVPLFINSVGSSENVNNETVDFPEEFRIQELPWKKTAFNDYHKTFVMNGLGFIGVRKTLNGNEFLMKAPAFVYHYWLKNFEGVGKSKTTFPISFSPHPQNILRSTFQEIHSLVVKSVRKLNSQKIPQYQIDKILTNDVMVQFKWTPSSEFDLSSIIEEDENRDISTYLKVVKRVLSRSKR